jgi:hypothetical protein
VVEFHPTLSEVPMSDPGAALHLAAGVYQLEEGGWRWTAGQPVLVLKPPGAKAQLVVEFFLPDAAPGRELRAWVNDKLVAAQSYPGPGAHRLEAAVEAPGAEAVVRLSIDRTFRVAGDNRELGFILRSVALR